LCSVILITCMWTAVVVDLHTFPFWFGCITNFFFLTVVNSLMWHHQSVKSPLWTMIYALYILNLPSTHIKYKRC
jgi:multisubunit Na+/H+ antiporter MnhE subunit